MKPYTAANLGPTDKPLVMRGLDLPQATRLLDLREEEIRELERLLGKVSTRLWEHHEYGHIQRMASPGTYECGLCTKDGNIFEEIDAALASQPAPEPVKLPEGIVLPCVVKYVGSDYFNVVDADGYVLAYEVCGEVADWICAALNAAGGGK